ncbi:MAG: TVP38/TMEM64 family protein, partial [Elusimicrobia bacterium]|nr:TVP38/TMEM64 family protein [Elusimicrobiota bacterium]
AGQGAFVLLYAAAAVAFLPGSVLTLGAGAAFGLWRGFILVSLGSTLGACAAFLVGRFLLRGWVERRLARFPAFAAVAAAVGAEGWKVVLLTRLSPVLPFNLLNYAYGLTPVSLGEYAWASWVGMMPGTMLYVYLGTAAGRLARGGGRTPAQEALFAGGLAATALAAWLVGRKAKEALARRVEG